jgi:hypothetical protein
MEQIPPPPGDDLVGALSGALRGDRTRVRDLLVARARQRLEARPREVPGPPAPLVPPRPLPVLSPPRPLQLRLGRRKVRVAAPQVALRQDLVALQRTTAYNDRQAFQAAARQQRELEALARAQKQLADRVDAVEERSDTALLDLLGRLGGLEQQVSAAAVQQRSVGTRVARQGRVLRAQQSAVHLQKVTAAVNTVQGAAFGEKGSVLGTNNLLLAGNQLLWGFVDPLLRFAGLDVGPSPSLLAWLAPLGSLLTGAATLGRRQHVRFVAGTETVTEGTTALRIPLAGRIAGATFDRIRLRTDIPASARVLDPTTLASFMGAPIAPKQEVLAAVVEGFLLLRMAPPGRTIRVAWMVDLGDDGG